MRPRTKAPKGEQPDSSLEGELTTYENVGLFQRAVNANTAYRYRGALLRYQKALSGAKPTVEARLKHRRSSWHTSVSRATARQRSVFTGQLCKASTPGAARTLPLPIKVPRHLPPYIEASTVAEMLNKAQQKSSAQSDLLHKDWSSLSIRLSTY